jgi:hypothetical protein
MFGLLRTAFTLLICVVVVGYFLGWFSFSRSAPDPQTNKVNINLSVDKNKMGADLQRIEQRVSKGIQDFNATQPGSNPPGTNPPVGFPPGSYAPNGYPPGNYPPGNYPPGSYPPAGQANAVPRLSLGPILMQPTAPNDAPLTNPPPVVQPQLQLQTPNYQFTLPLSGPMPGEGR